MKKNKSLIKHYKIFGFEFDNYDFYIFLTIILGVIFFIIISIIFSLIS